VSPLRVGYALAVTLRRLYPEAWQSKNYLRLLGHEKTFRALLEGSTVDALLALVTRESDWQDFMEARKKYLLY
jgi:hypothetical protein